MKLNIVKYNKLEIQVWYLTIRAFTWSFLNFGGGRGRQSHIHIAFVFFNQMIIEPSLMILILDLFCPQTFLCQYQKKLKCAESNKKKTHLADFEI